MIVRLKKKQIIKDAKKSHGTLENYIDEMCENLDYLSEKVNALMNGTN